MARLSHIIINILLIPFIISHVGTVRYGIWVALFAVVDYFTLLDFGATASTIKYVADYYTSKRIEKVGQVIALTFIFNCIYIPFLVVAYLLSDHILLFFHIEFNCLSEAKFIFTGVLANFAISQFSSVFRSTLIGIQRIYINNWCQIVYLFLYAGGTLFLLSKGYGLQGIIILIFFLRCARMFFNMIYVFKIMPLAVRGMSKIDLKMVSSFFRYGIKLQLASLAGFFNFQIDKMLIGHYLKIEFVAFYEIGAKLALMIRHIPSVMMGPLIPASAELEVEGDTTRLEKLYLRANFYFVLAAAPISTFFIVNGREIVGLWLGKLAHPYCALSLQVLSVAFFFQMLSGAVTSIGRGIGLIKYELQNSILNASLNLFLSIILIFQLGFLGALLGTTLAMAVSNMIYFARFSRFMKIGLLKMVESILIKPVLSSFCAGVSSFFLKSYLSGSKAVSDLSRMESFLQLLLVGIVFIIIYIIGLIKSRAVGRSDLKLFERALAAFSGLK